MSPDSTGGSQNTTCTGPENTKEVRDYITENSGSLNLSIYVYRYINASVGSYKSDLAYILGSVHHNLHPYP